MFKWLGSSAGRTFLQGAAFVGSATAFAIHHLPQTVFIDKYKEFVQSYEKGMEQPVKPNVQRLYEQVLKDLKIAEREKKLLRIFSVFGFDLFHAGSTNLVTGAIIGIPVNFSYESEKDINRGIQLVQKPIDWTSAAGQALQDSLVLSENARKFAIAREVIRTGTIEVWIKSLTPTFSIVFGYILAKTLNERLKIRQHPSRFLMYTIVSAFFFAINCSITDLTNLSYESSSDEEAASLSSSYAEGGYEFYKKLQKRNIAIRELMGKEGKSLYTVTGNDIVYLRITTTPITERLSALEEIVKAKEIVEKT